MRIGFCFRSSTELVKLLAAAAAIFTLPLAASAQPPSSNYSLTDSGNGRAVQAIYTTPSAPANSGRQSSYADSNGNPLIVPAGYYQQGGGYGGGCGCGGGGYGGGCNGGCYGGQGQCGCGYGGGPNSCMPMGCGGTDPPVGYDLMNDVGTQGDLVDQRGPHYFDIRTEAVWLHRDKSFGPYVAFDGLNLTDTPLLTSNSLDIQDQVGFRAIGRYDICPLAVVEFGYTGIYDYSDSATVYSEPPPGNLFSLFSRQAPGTGLFGINQPSPLPPSEQAIQQSISLKSDLQSAEISYRRYWLGWSPRISGTLLGGFRYTKLDENFEFDSLGTPFNNNIANPEFQYHTDAVNNLSGFQAGGDVWLSVMQGVRIGAEGKAGIYDNHYNLDTRIQDNTSGTLSDVITPDRFRADKAAFIGEASFDVVADITPSISLRAGYEVLFMDSLVLAGDNFNQVSPYGNQGTRVAFVDDNGKLFYSGAHAGIEYTW